MAKHKLLIDKNRHLGTLLTYKDKKGRWSLKFSFSRKFKNVDFLGTQKRDANKFDINNATSMKQTPKGSSLELSYKFDDKKLEIKNEIKKGSIERTFFNVDIPALSPLFLIRIQNLSSLPIVIPDSTDIEIGNGSTCQDFIINFSFPGNNGTPWTDIIFKDKIAAVTIFSLPYSQPNKLYIAVTCDSNPPKGDYGLSIWFPKTHTPTKV